MFEIITGTEPLENRQISPEQTSPLANAEINSNSPTTESSEGLVTKSSKDPETKGDYVTSSRDQSRMNDDPVTKSSEGTSTQNRTVADTKDSSEGSGTASRGGSFTRSSRSQSSLGNGSDQLKALTSVSRTNNSENKESTCPIKSERDQYEKITMEAAALSREKWKQTEGKVIIIVWTGWDII